jgi:prepilin-type N-terminal cleavage/methylation domain-containing protein
MKPTFSPSAFTLIELLVVIAIIALLAAVSVPAVQQALLSAQENAALQNARQIGLGLRTYSNDYGGVYPTGTNSYGEQIKNSNDAFRSLIPTYVDNEQIFAVPRSVDGPKADNKISPYTEILKPGENHFAFIEGLDSTSNSLWPLIVDGANSQGKYTNVEGNPGGVWKGTKAIVINADSSAHLVPLLGPDTARYIPRFDDPTQDELDLSSYMGSTAQLLEPAAN